MAISPNYRIFFIVFTIMTLGVWSYPSITQALTLTPTRFEIRGDPGDILTEEMLLINENETAETFYSSFANFEAQGDSGTPAFVEPKDDLGTWMTTDSSAVYLAPHEQKIIPFKITIPKDAEPGGHFAVIFWGTSPSGAQGQVSIGAKTGILVLLSVNGEVKEAAGLLDFNTVNNTFFYKTLPVSMEYRIKNDGGDRIKPEGEIVIRNTLYLPTEKLDANPTEGNVLPASIRKISVDWINYERQADSVTPEGMFKKFWSNAEYQWKNFAVGLYSANLKLAYGSEREQVKKTIFFFVFPWQLVLVMLVSLIVVIYGGIMLIKRYNKWIIKKAGAGTKLPPDSFNG